MSRKPKPTETDEPEMREIMPTADGSFAVTETRDNPPRQLRGMDAKPLRALTFRDEQDADGYHNLTPVAGGNVATREMSPDDFEAFRAQVKANIEALKVPARNEQQAQALEAQGKPDEAAKLRAEAQAVYQRAQIDNTAATEDLLNRFVAGWDFERPYTAGAWRALRADDINALINDIIEKSAVGRGDVGFLADAS